MDVKSFAFVVRDDKKVIATGISQTALDPFGPVTKRYILNLCVAAGAISKEQAETAEVEIHAETPKTVPDGPYGIEDLKFLKEMNISVQ